MVCSCVIPSKSVFAANNILLMRNSNHARSFWSLLCEMEDRDRFPELSESELTSLLDQKNSDNTKKATKVALNVFRDYLKERKIDEDSCSIERQVGNCSEKVLRWSQKKEWRALHQSFTCRNTLWPSAVLQLTQDWYYQRPRVFWSQHSLSSGNFGRESSHTTQTSDKQTWHQETIWKWTVQFNSAGDTPEQSFFPNHAFLL